MIAPSAYLSLHLSAASIDFVDYGMPNVTRSPYYVPLTSTKFRIQN